MQINWIAEILDTLISITGKYGAWLNAKKRRACFIVWSCCITYWAIRDIHLGLYSQSIFCLISLGINIYGYIKWKN